MTERLSRGFIQPPRGTPFPKANVLYFSCTDPFDEDGLYSRFEAATINGWDPKHTPSKINECAPVGPLSPYIDSYIRLLNEEGYAPASIRDQIRVIVMFSQALQRSGCEIRDLF